MRKPAISEPLATGTRQVATGAVEALVAEDGNLQKGTMGPKSGV